MTRPGRHALRPSVESCESRLAPTGLAGIGTLATTHAMAAPRNAPTVVVHPTTAPAPSPWLSPLRSIKPQPLPPG